MKAFLILPMILLSLSAAASSKWEMVAKGANESEFIIDSNSYQKSGDSITFWQRTNFVERTPEGDLSSKAQFTINCKTRELRGRYLMTYADHNNLGKLLFQSTWNDS